MSRLPRAPRGLAPEDFTKLTIMSSSIDVRAVQEQLELLGSVVDEGVIRKFVTGLHQQGSQQLQHQPFARSISRAPEVADLGE